MTKLIEEWTRLIVGEGGFRMQPSDNMLPSSNNLPVEKQDEIDKIDNFLPDHLYDSLYAEMARQSYRGEWPSNNTSDKHGHWNCNFVAYDNWLNLANKEGEIINPVVTEIWNWLKENSPEFKDKVLLRCYLNAHTYGTEGYFHTDSTREGEKTMVLYVVDGEWNKDWAGETAFVEDGEIVLSVLPKRNRAVLFDSKISHCARGVTRIFNGLRRTFVMKIRDKRSPNFEKLSAFLVRHRAFTKGHEKGTLHDHLVRVYELLEKKGASEHVCFAGGLHSVFGTNAYADGILTLAQRDLVISEFGEKVFELAALFSIVNRPSTLENPEAFEEGKYHLKMNTEKLVAVDSTTLDELRLIEAANLMDQGLLNINEYPKIYDFYENYGQNA